MDLHKWCVDFSKLINESPMRKNTSNLKLVDMQPELNIITNDLDTIKGNLLSTLKVVLVGEVKAGKSTLINALVGSAISPANVLEATSVVWEIGYADVESTTILFRDSTQKIVEHAAVSTLFGTTEESLQLARSIEKIIVTTNIHRFKQLYLIDTPGLATITEQNALLTKSIMQDVDLILWVFNGNHLGQTDISQELSDVSMLGKPIIAVLNKIDESEETPENLIKFLNRSCGEYFQKIFALSAFQAFQNIGESDAISHIGNDRFNLFTDYLMENVNLKSALVKRESIEGSCRALARKECVLHESIGRSLNFLIDQHKAYISDLAHDKARLSQDMEVLINNKCHQLESSSELHSEIEALLANESFIEKTISKVSSKKSVFDTNAEHLFYKYSDQVGSAVSEQYIRRMKIIMNEMSEKVTAQFKTFQHSEQQVLGAELALLNLVGETIDTTGAMVQSAKETAVVAGIFGAGVGTWGALFGAHAASYTIIGGLSAVALPFAFAGAIAGVAIGYWKHQKKKEVDLINNTLAMKQQIIDQIKQSLLQSIHIKIEENFAMLEEQYAENLCSGFKIDYIQSLSNEINNYVFRVNEKIYNNKTIENSPQTVESKNHFQDHRTKSTPDRIFETAEHHHIDQDSIIIQSQTVQTEQKSNVIRKGEVSFDEFLNICTTNKIPSDSNLSLASRVDQNSSAIKTLSFRLHPQDTRLEGVTARANNTNSDNWFDDGFELRKLGVDWEEAGLRSFVPSAETKGTALDTVIAFDEFLCDVEKYEIKITMMAFGVSAILAWVVVTLAKSEYQPKSDYLLERYNLLFD